MESVAISLKEYLNGFFILAFDLNPTKDNRLFLYEPNTGSLSIKMRRRSPLPENITVLAMSSYSKQLFFVEDKALISDETL